MDKMTPAPWLTLGAGRFLSLKADRELLQAIVVLDQALDDDPMDSDLEDVFEALNALADGTAEAQRVHDILAHKQLDPMSIKSAWERVRTLVSGSLPQRYRPLGMPLDALRQPDAQRALEWTILDEGKPHTAQIEIAPLQFELMAEASLNAELEAHPDKLPTAYPAELPRPQVRIGARGRLKLGSSAQLPVFRVGLNARGSAAASAAIDWFFYNKGKALFAAALVHNLGRLRSPLELDALDDMLARYGEDAQGLAAVQLNVDAGLSFGAEVRLAEPLAFIAAGMPAQAGVSLGYTAVESGSIQCLIHRDVSSLVVRLRRLADATRLHEAALSIELAVGSAIQDTSRLLIGKLAAWSTLLDRLQQALPSDPMLKSRLADSLHQALSSSPYQEALSIALGFNDAKRASQRLADRIIQAVETTTTRWQDDTLAAAERLLQRLIPRLRLASPQDTQLRDLALKAVQEVLEAERKRLDDTVRQAIAGDGYREIAQLLDGLGHKVDATLGQVEQRLQAVSGPIRSLLGRYQANLDKLTQALEQAITAKLQARLHTSRSLAQQGALELVLRFDPRHTNAQTLFRQLLTGNLEELFNALRKQPTGGPVTLVSGELAQQLRLTQKDSTDLILFDIQLGSQFTAISEIDYVVDHAGNLQVRTRGQVEACRRGWREGRCQRFINVFELATAARTRKLDLSLELSQEDEDLNLTDVRGFFGSLEKAGLIRSGATTLAMDILRTLDARDPRSLLKGRLEAGFILTGTAIERLLGLDARGQVTRRDQEVLRIAAEEVATAGRQVGRFEYRLDNELLQRIRAQFPQYTPPQPGDIVEAIIAMTPELANELASKVRTEETTNPLTELRDIWAVGEYHKHAAGIVRMVQLLREVYLSGQQPTAWRLDDYVQAQAALNEHLKHWLRVGGKRFVLLRDEIRPFTVAFLRILARLGGLPSLAVGGSSGLAEGPSVMTASLTLAGRRYELV